MSYRNLLEMEEIRRSSSNDMLPPQPKPRPRQRSSDSKSTLVRVKSDDDVLSISSNDQLVENSEPVMRKAKRNVAFTSFENEAFLEDETHVSDASRKSSASNSFDESSVSRPKPKKRLKMPINSFEKESKVLSFSANEDSESGLSTNNAAQLLDEDNLRTDFKNKNQGEESDQSSGTFTIENEKYRDTNRVTKKPPIPKPKRRDNEENRPPPSSARSEDRSISDENDDDRVQTKEHSVVEIESDQEADDKGKGDATAEVDNTASAAKTNVKSRLGKLFASSSKSKKSSETDNGGGGDELNVSGDVKEKGGLVNRWRKTFSRSTSKPLQDEEDGGGELEERKSKAERDVAPTSKRIKKKLTKREDTRIFMPEEQNEDSDVSQEQEKASSSREKVKKGKSKDEIDVEAGETRLEETSQPERKSRFKPFAKLIVSKNKEKAKSKNEESNEKSSKDKLKQKTQEKPKTLSPERKPIEKATRKPLDGTGEFSASSSDEQDAQSGRDSDSAEEPARAPSVEKTVKTKSKSKTPDKQRENIPCIDSVSGKDLLFGVTIHSSDMLPLNPNVIHPVVKVTVMYQNGKLLRRNKDAVKSIEEESKKSEKKTKRRTKQFENEGSDEECTTKQTESVLPIMSQPCRARQSIPTFVPTWNELLVFEEPFKRFAIANENTPEEKQPIVFFEVMDFLPMNSSGNLVTYSGFHGSEVGWYKVAWAFLKPIGANGVRNLNKKLRLQLFKPVKIRSKDGTQNHEVFSWWKSGTRDKVSSTLYVTPKGIIPPETKSASLRQLLSMRKEQLTQAILDSQLATNKKKASKKASSYDLGEYPNWTRMEGQSCKPPNKVVANLPASQIASLNIVVSGNVFCTRFSPCGKMLAAGLDTDELHVILLFHVPSWKLMKSLKGHHGIIYELAWRMVDVDDTSSFHYLASASADSTAMVWQMQNGDEKTLSLLKILYHPSYVYCVKFHPSHPCLLVTGCFDFIIRVWDLKPDHSKNDAGQGRKQKSRSHESSPTYLLDKHMGFVNAISFDNSGQHLFSGDGCACIIKWSCVAPSTKKTWRLEKDVKLHHGNVPVNSISIHPAGSRLLVQLRDNFLKILDVVTLIPLQTFSGFSNERFQIRSCFSPCGNLVLSGSEDSTLCIWDADTGKILQLRSAQNHPNCIVACVDYHPLDYYVVVGLTSAISEPSPIVIYFYDQPKSVNYSMLKKTAMKFKKSLEHSGSQSLSFENDLNEGNPSKQSPRPTKRVDSSEKFMSIIQKLDTALYFAQQRSKQRQSLMEAAVCEAVPVTNDIRKTALPSMPMPEKEQETTHAVVGDRLPENEHLTMPRRYLQNIQERPRSASSARSKRDKFRRSNEQRDTKSDSEQSHFSKHQQSVERDNALEFSINDANKANQPDFNEIHQVQPKPLTRKSLIRSDVQELEDVLAENIS